jgi:hypothetical protein
MSTSKLGQNLTFDPREASPHEQANKKVSSFLGKSTEDDQS